MSHLPRRCRKYLLDKQYDFSEADENGQAVVIIKPWKLCEGKYDHDAVSLLLLLPDGYPDAAPDMFYVHPWIKLRGCSSWPNRANAAREFQGIKWQRWSRHWSDWRPGVDGMATWLLKVRYALEAAK